MLKLSQADYEALRAHGEETYPHECCGILLGKGGVDGNHVHQIRACRKHTYGSRARPLQHCAGGTDHGRSGRRAGWGSISSASTTRIRTIRRSGRRRTSKRPTGSAAHT